MSLSAKYFWVMMGWCLAWLCIALMIHNRFAFGFLVMAFISQKVAGWYTRRDEENIKNGRTDEIGR